MLASLGVLAGTRPAFAGPADVTWLEPERFSSAPGATVGVQVLSAAAFDGAGQSLPPMRMASIDAELGGEAATLVMLPVLNGVTRYLTVFPHPGVAVLRAELKPEARSISRSEVEDYMRALHVTDEVRAAWGQIGPPNPWIEVRTIAVKTFVRIGEPTAGDRSWQAAAKSGIDLVPEQDPTLLDENARFAVRVLRDGKSLPGAIVEYLSRGETRQHVVLADPDGRVEAALNAKGEWLIRCFDVRRSAAANHDWDVVGFEMVVATR